MTFLTLPRVASLSYDGHPEYAARALHCDPDAENVVWFRFPVIPAGLKQFYRWAETTEVRSVHIALDVAACAELLYHRLDLDPEGIDGETALSVIDAELDRVHCDMRRCAADCAADQADHYDGGRRYDNCVRAASRLLEVSV